ncbi:MAG: hypothetical protein LEGION0398_MBIBDBAK_01131 [Legionellaceae bacterium]
MTLDDMKPFIDWMQMHPHLAGFVTFLISIAESLAVVGLLIPGTIVMGAIGSLVGSGVLPSLDVILWASAGAIVGDGLSYWLGYHYHGHIREMWPFRNMPKLMYKGETFFLKNGRKSVFLGRFIGPIRPIIPVIAGMMNMPPWHFTLANVTSAITWAPVYMLPGYLLGAASLQLAPHAASRLLVMAIILLLSLWAIYWLLKHILRLFKCGFNYCINQLWFYIHYHFPHSRFYTGLSYPDEPDNSRPLTIFITLILGSLGFVWLTYSIVNYSYLWNWNNALWQLASNLQGHSFVSAMINISFLSKLPIWYGLSLLIIAYLLIRQEWKLSLSWFFFIALITFSIFVLQIIFKIPKPIPPALVDWSYPNLHSALMGGICGVIYLFYLRHKESSKRKSGLGILLIALIFLISFSQLYFGLAWLTDIVSGLLLGGIASLLFALLCLNKKSKPFNSWYLIGMMSLIITVFAIGYGRQHHYSMKIQTLFPYYYNTLDKKAWEQGQPILPFYRHNLIGKPIELLNLEWAGNIEEIKKNLLAKNWQVVPKTNLIIILNRIAAINREEQLPLSPHLYLHQNPVLVMTKLIKKEKKMLVLRLWNSHIAFNTKDQPLWLGSIAYHKPWKFHFSRQIFPDKNDDYDYSAAIQVLMNDISSIKINKLETPKEFCDKVKKGCSPFILLLN